MREGNRRQALMDADGRNTRAGPFDMLRAGPFDGFDRLTAGMLRAGPFDGFDRLTAGMLRAGPPSPRLRRGLRCAPRRERLQKKGIARRGDAPPGDSAVRP